MKDPRIGEELAGYLLEARIGQGGMGVVYRAEHTVLQRKAALKLLPPNLAENAGFRERFLHESRAAASLHHPNIVMVYDAGRAGDHLYIAMQYVEGADLGELLRREGRLPLPRALAILDQVASALDAAHERDLVHRDVKPGNVLVGAGDHAYLTDFGLTKPLKAAEAFTATGQVVGTIYYVAPEQIRGGTLDGGADVYALGCVLYECLTGTVPYERDSDVGVMYAHIQDPPPRLSEVRPDLPKGIERVILKALSKKRQDRYATCAEMIHAAWVAAEEGGALERPAHRAPSRREIPGEGDDPWVLTDVEREFPGMRDVPDEGDDPWVATDTERARPAGTRTLKALIAGADPSVRAVIQLALNTGRFELIEVEDPAQAVEIAHEESPELVFLDWSAQAPELCRRLRADPATADAKVIILVEWTEEPDADAVLDAGADDLITKPFSPLQLVVKVRHLLGPEALAG